MGEPSRIRVSRPLEPCSPLGSSRPNCSGKMRRCTRSANCCGIASCCRQPIYANVDRDRLRELARPWPDRWCGMTILEQQAADYLRIRRALGFKLERAGEAPAQYLPYLDTIGQDRAAVDNALVV